ncbi:MAG: TonB-dependent receptor [Nannocystaceae bacterium]
MVTTASRTEQRVGDTAVATRVMDREAIEASGAENLEELLEEAPGVQVTRSFGGAGGAGVRMQGLDPRYTLILIDGQRVNGRIAGVIDLSRFQAEDIEQIELVEGPSSSLYGSDAMAGVVNVITRKGRRPYEAEVHGAYGSFHTVDVSARAAMRRRRWGAQLSGGWHRTDGFVLPEEGRAAEDASTTGNAQSNANVALGADYSPDTPIDFSLAGRVDFQHRDIRGVDFRPPRANFDRRNLTRIVGATLTPELRWDAPARLRLIGRFNYFNDLLTLDQRGSDLEDRSERTIDQLGELTAQYDHQVAGAHLLTAGLTGSFETIESPRVTDDQRARQRVALFVQDEWTIVEAPRVALVPGARLDHDTQFGGALSPKAALRVDPTSWLVLRASYGLGFRAPDFKELYLLFANPAAGYRVVGNPALKPERSRGADAGLTLRLPSRPRFAGELSLHYFHNVIDGLIAAPTSSSAFDADGTRVFRYENLDAARTRGGEVSAGLRLLRLVGLDGSYTFTDARERIVADDGGVTERPLAGRARHRGAARLWFHHPRWGLRAQVRAAINGAQIYYTEATQVGVRGAATVTLTPYATVDVRVAETFLERYTLFLGADNLANAGDPVYSPLVPRSFYGGFTIRY